jgi:hypothetical protein
MCHLTSSETSDRRGHGQFAEPAPRWDMRKCKHWIIMSKLSSKEVGQRRQCNGYATGWTVRGSNSGGMRDLTSLQNVQTGSGTTTLRTQFKPASLSPEIKRLGREADRLPPSSVDVKNEWSNTSTPPLCLHGMPTDNCNFICIHFAILCYVSYSILLLCFLMSP